MKTYTGGCQCGEVKYEAKIELKGGMTCNCSHCGKKGFVLTFIPKSQFTLLSGEGEMTEYYFNKKKIRHLFCKTCGVESYAESAGDIMMVNLRCLDNVDISTLPITTYNGKDI